MQVYLGYRHNTADFDVVDGAGNGVADAGVEDFDTVITGALIPF